MPFSSKVITYDLIKKSLVFLTAIAFQLLSFNSLAGVPSRDFSVYEEQALGVYLSFFGRVADPAGRASWSVGVAVR
jgi:hypothetical protein